METIVIKSKNPSNAKFILGLAKKLGDTGKILTSKQQEDFLFATIIDEEKTGETVSRETIFKKLKGL